ncbi:MAG: o-succinylbenzoate synthase [Acidobacteria bacterium]|jgi:O-succinylbenzoate synthase|nr:o-succinylbenzoate synthase [Acidobacteriota bacterium]
MANDQPVPAWMEEPLGVIDRIELLTVSLPFVAPFGTSVATWSCKEALLVRIADKGLVAWGECVADPDPYYASETTTSARHIIRDFLLPELKPDYSLAQLLERFRRVRGNEMAKAALENALLDLLAKRRGLPLHGLLGFAPRRIMSGISIGFQDDVPSLLAKVEEAAASGYHRVKMKIGRGRDVEWVRAVRQRFPGLALMADANGDYAIADAGHLAALDGFALTMIEQPLSYHDIFLHSLLQARLITPLCLDESIHSCDDAEAAIALKSCRVINIKQGRVGGFLEAVKMARLCAAQDIPAWSGGMDETGIGRALNIQLQAAPGFTLPGDTSETRRYFHEDIVEPPVLLDKEGFIAMPQGPGIGVDVMETRVEKYLLDRELAREHGGAARQKAKGKSKK